MLSFDGLGYGRSDYWLYYAKSIAKENNEDCGHGKLHISFRSSSTDIYNLRVKISCKVCESVYSKTEKCLLEQFKNLYGMTI